MKCGLALTEPGTQNDEAIKAEARALRKRTSLLLLLTVLLLLLLFFGNIGRWILRVSDEKMYHSTAYQLHAPACSFVAMSIEYYHR